ncbi:MAG TPA: Lrp/AsnC ligand binding domain-containing protein [bacterium]|nr:Lrp/AsnC ligand binding domain-containing protein [bacterium]
MNERLPMAETAFVLINLDRGTPAEVARLIRALPGVAQAHAVMGDYDVLAVIHADLTRDISALVDAHIRTIDGVAKIVTCVTVPT